MVVPPDIRVQAVLLQVLQQRAAGRVHDALGYAGGAAGEQAKLLTLFHPASGEIRAKGVRHSTNAILHPWLREQLRAALASAPPLTPASGSARRRQQWQRWQAGLSEKITLPQRLPALPMVVVLDNLSGHKTPALVLWLFRHGIMPLYTPLSGSWLDMAESVQRIIRRRALAGQHPQTPE